MGLDYNRITFLLTGFQNASDPIYTCIRKTDVNSTYTMKHNILPTLAFGLLKAGIHATFA